MYFFFRKYLKTFLAFFFIFSYIFYSFDFKVEASEVPITSSPKLVIPDSNTEIDSKYNFVPKFTKDTKVQTFGSNAWKNTYWLEHKDRSRTFVSLVVNNQNTLKGKVGVRYTNIGNYNGQKVDLVITVNDWKNYFTRAGNVSFATTTIGVAMSGYSEMDMTWKYVKAGTNTAVNVSGYFTISDVDIYQGVKFSAATSNAIKSVMIQNRNNKLKFNNDGGQYHYYDTTGIDVPDHIPDPNHQFTFLYENQNSLRFKWTSGLDKQGWRPDQSWGTTYPDGDYFFYEMNKPARTKIAQPTKQVSHTANLKMNEEIKYTLIHEVPQEDPKFYYTNYVFEDTVDSILENINVVVKNQIGENVTNKFSISKSGNKVTVSANASTLKSPDFYGERYHVEVTGKLNKAKLTAALKDKAEYLMENVATLKVNSRTFTTNKVQTKIAKRNITVNHIDRATNKTIVAEKFTGFDGDTYSYESKKDLLFENKYKYYPEEPQKQTGTINGKDLVLNFYYSKPNSDVGLKKIQIYTKSFKSGLPVKLNFNVKALNTNWKNDKIKVQLFEKATNAQVLSKEVTAGELEKEISLVIPSNVLKINENKEYEARVVPNNKKEIYVAPEAQLLGTQGYTASQKALEANAKEVNKVEYKGVVMTEREIGKEMKSYFESFLFSFSELDRKKSGYGFEINQELVYTNDLSLTDGVSDHFIATVDSSAVDGDIYSSNYGVTKVYLENKKQISGNKLIKKFQFPQVFVQSKSGQIISKEQQTEMTRLFADIKTVDGGNKLYVPIWIDELGLFDFSFESEDPLGVNEISIKVIDQLEVFAYMYAHLNSETLEKDEILIEPIDLKAPFPDGLPEGWSQSDLDWLQNK